MMEHEQQVVSVGTAISRFAADRLQNHQFTTIDNWKTTFKFLIQVYGEKQAVCNVGLQRFREQINSYISLSLNPGYAVRTLKKRYGHIHVFFEYCCDEDWLKVNPLQEWRLHSPSGKTMRRDCAPTTQVDEVQEAMAQPWKDIFIILRYTGLRIGELLNNGLPSHRPALWKGNRIYLYSAKIKEWQSQPVHQDDVELKLILGRWTNNQGELDFGSIGGKDFWEIMRTVNRGVCEINRRRPVPNPDYLDNLHPHDLRRFAGQEVYNDGTLDDAQAFLRHKLRSTTEQSYVHTATEQKKLQAAEVAFTRRKRLQTTTDTITA